MLSSCHLTSQQIEGLKETRDKTTSKRIDFTLTGLNENQEDSVVIIELKQWSEASKVEGKDGLVLTRFGKNYVETPHPSYQAWSYASLIENCVPVFRIYYCAYFIPVVVKQWE